MNALQLARQEKETIIAKQRVQMAISSNIPFNASYQFKPGEEVLLYPEEERITWILAYNKTRIEKKSFLSILTEQKYNNQYRSNDHRRTTLPYLLMQPNPYHTCFFRTMSHY